MLPSLRRAVPLALIAAALVPASAAATVTRSSVTTPTDPAYRLLQSSDKAALSLLVAGTTDGAPEDRVVLSCGSVELRTPVEVAEDGSFSAEVPLRAFPRSLCTLRALPYKVPVGDPAPFSGPAVAITYFNPNAVTTAVLGSEGTVVMDYEAETVHRRGPAGLHSAAGGGLYRDTWSRGAQVGSAPKIGGDPIEVDGRAAYAAADAPRFLYNGEVPAAPAGYNGVRAALALDERTGDVVVHESQPIVRCNGTDAARPKQEDCTAVVDTGVRLERTIAFTDEHALADVRDRWVSSDGQAHSLRLVYAHRAGEGERPLWRLAGEPTLTPERPLWRLAGEPAFTPRGFPDAVVPSGPGSILVDTGEGFGALSYDPAPSVFAFGGTGVLSELVELTVPAGGVAPVRRSFASGDSVIAVERLVQRYAQPEILPVPDNPPTTTPTPQPQPQPQPRKQCRVPKIKRGAKLASVKSALTKAGCKPPRKAKRARSKKTRKGRVIALTRKAGVVLPEGTAIGIKVSSGR